MAGLFNKVPTDLDLNGPILSITTDPTGATGIGTPVGATGGASVIITVPHPRHDHFLTDTTHVRPILPDQFTLFSKRANLEWAKQGYANTPLGEFLDVDFEIAETNWIADEKWVGKIRKGEIDEGELANLAIHQNNVVREIKITLKVLKPNSTRPYTNSVCFRNLVK